MRRFRILFLVCIVALLGPLALLIERALHSVAIEREVRHQTVAERVFDEMERALSRLLEDEEKRPVDGYLDTPGSALPFVVGHFQIDAEGTVRSASSSRHKEQGRTIEETVGGFWRRHATEPNLGGRLAAQLPGTTLEMGKAKAAAPKQEAAEEDRHQADNEVSAFDALRALNKGASERVDRQRKAAPAYRRDEPAIAAGITGIEGKHDGAPAAGASGLEDSPRGPDELPAMVGRVVDANRLLLYRTVAIGSHLERQGLVVDIARWAMWLREHGIGSNGLDNHAAISFWSPFDAPPAEASPSSSFIYQHRFAEPFDGLSARMSLRPLPGVGSTTYVYALCALVFASVLLGLAAIYRMVSVVFAYAERRSNFVAAVSHELKTPLTAIRMYGEMLRDGMVLNESKRDEYYRHITTESERLSRLINNVLEFARLEKGTRDVSLMDGPIAPVLKELAELVQPHLASQGFTLQVRCDPTLPPVRYERDALMQVLWNLIDNAVKYGGDGTLQQIDLCCDRAGDQVVLSVRDHGAGVASRHLGKIFEPFYRGESELTRRSKGTGLGLALVRGLVERMGATVGGRNVPDGGFEVQVAFRATV